MRRRGKVLAAGAAGLVLLSFAAGYGLVHGWGPRPIVVAGPPGLPTLTASLRTDGSGTFCLGADDGWDKTSAPAFFWVGVDRDPQSVTAVWWPMLEVSDCRVLVTDGDRTTAEALAAAIRTAPAWPRGVLHCPADFGGLVDLYFAYPGGRWERVQVRLTGCSMLSGPGRQSRRAQLGAAFAALAPPGEWSRRLR